MGSIPDWSGLVPDLLAEIATKLSFIEDFTAFRGVCTSWRAAAHKDRFAPVSKLPLLMLSGKAICSDVREFYSLYKRKIFSRIPVPESNGKGCIGAGFGWIMTAGILNGDLNLVKPMSSAKIPLPTIVSEYRYIFHAVLSANPSETSDFMLMIDVDHRLVFWRNGDSHWTKLEMKTNPNQNPNFVPNFCYYKKKMYITGFHGNVWMWDPFLPKSPAEIILTVPIDSWLLCNILIDYYLVESRKGELLRITKEKVYEGKSYNSLHFGIVQIDTVNRASRVMEHLDQDAIFIGAKSAVSVVAADFPGIIKANHIYYIDEDQNLFKRGKGMGAIYNVENKSTKRFNVNSVSSTFRPFWVIPSLN